MKAITLKSPWWELVIAGKKTIETRTWKTKHRGKLLICASKPKGMAVAICNLVDCRTMEKKDEIEACISVYPRANAWILQNITPIEEFSVTGKQGMYNVDITENDIHLKEVK